MSDYRAPERRGGSTFAGIVLGMFLAVAGLGVAAWLYTGARLMDFLRSPLAAMST